MRWMYKASSLGPDARGSVVAFSWAVSGATGVRISCDYVSWLSVMWRIEEIDHVCGHLHTVAILW